MGITEYRKAVREKCLDCCGGLKREVARCEVKRCPLWALRQPVAKERKKIDDK